MIRIVRATDLQGKALYLNPYHIIEYSAFNDGSFIFMTDREYAVKDSPTKLTKAIQTNDNLSRLEQQKLLAAIGQIPEHLLSLIEVGGRIREYVNLQQTANQRQMDKLIDALEQINSALRSTSQFPLVSFEAAASETTE